MTYIRYYHINLYRLLDFGLLVTPQQHKCGCYNMQCVMVKYNHLCSYFVLQLLDKKVNTDVNKCRDNGTSPLFTACQKGHLDIVLQLLDKKVNTDVNKCRDNGASPLFIACQNGHDKIVVILLTHGADI
jgi:ankyrin repeat protein